ncbi:MAG: hypothetical protein IJ449_10905 [Clostridia bacterium]|nr:hypothetical protein [Clostridia bacterium]
MGGLLSWVGLLNMTGKFQISAGGEKVFEKDENYFQYYCIRFRENVQWVFIKDSGNL